MGFVDSSTKATWCEGIPECSFGRFEFVSIGPPFASWRDNSRHYSNGRLIISQRVTMTCGMND
jgi:hypothetical protein